MLQSTVVRRNGVRIAATILAILSIVALAAAQLAPAVGIRSNVPSVHAFTNARIVTAPGKVIENGTMVVRDGMITAVGANAAVPADARVWDMTGKTIYPGLIESICDIGMPKKPQGGRNGGDGGGNQPKDEARGPHHWNESVTAAQNAADIFVPDSKAAEKLRGMGFTTGQMVPQKGIVRGTTAVFDLGDNTASQLLVNPSVAQYVTFETAGGDNYPNSLMGSIALIRQTMIDANWERDVMAAVQKYPAEAHPDYVGDLAALKDVVGGTRPVLFETTDEQGILRAAAIAKEFSLKYWVRGSGGEYRRLDAIKKTGVPIILPVNFPEAPSVQSPEEALDASLQSLRYWDEAPENPKRLADAGVTFAFTTSTLKDASSFPANIRKAMERGLSRDAVLAALTTTPARLLGIDKKTGSLEAGKLANFVVTDGDLFAEKTKVYDTWVDGKRYEVKSTPQLDPRGTWAAKFSGAVHDSFTVVIKGEAEKPSGSLTVKSKDTSKAKEIKLATLSVNDLRIAMSFEGDSAGMKGVMRLTGVVSGTSLTGTGEMADGKSIQWSATRTAPFKADVDTSKPKAPTAAMFPMVYPDGEYGRPKVPDQPANLLIKNATIWTSGPDGNIEGGDMLVSKGKIVKVGKNLSAPSDAVVVDATGKHVTAGLIDCHSHSAVAGSVNETGKAITSECRIGDVIDADDIAIYHELAGGLTAANVLHGSANAIGGQNQVIKLRWGMSAEELKFEGAMPGIKFALGENPKQSNWGDRYTSRYPQTRSGVDQIIRDEFRNALDYEQNWKDFESGKTHIPPRRDLQVEAELEILRGKRLVHSHSYRQDEIEMLMRIGDDFNFQIGTFQHVLEGYKIADQLAVRGIGASTFSDWWAYKFEVYDAIPYNGALMYKQGVVVSYNSDSDEQACRLNTEAAKAVKYGNVPVQDALKFVTLNPAKQLRIDKRVGSLESGKDADFVVWSGDPLSAYSIAEQTWIDGRKFFDRDEDRKMADAAQTQRAALIQKVLSPAKDDNAGGGKKGWSAPKTTTDSFHDDAGTVSGGKENR